MFLSISCLIIDVILVVLFFATRSAIRSLNDRINVLGVRINKKYNKKGE